MVFGLSEDTWIVPETFSFFSRCFQILAMCCVLCPERVGGTTFSEWAFVLSLAIFFFLNCLEFIGPLNQNLLVQISGAGVGLLGTFILLVNSHSDEEIYRGKHYASILSGLSIVGSLLTGADFYYHMCFAKSEALHDPSDKDD